jgi:PKD repeat protein
LVRGAIVTALLVPLLLWLSGCWLFNVEPVAAFTVRATIIELGEALAFSGILSSDEDGIIAKFEWDFGDGGSATGESVTHTYTMVGSYTVVLRVTDDRGATATAQKVITVNPADGNGGGGGPDPTASFTATPLTGKSPLTVTFNASASISPEAAITAYFWDFGDGTTGAGITTTHTYGPLVTTTYNVVLRIIDDRNNEDTATKSITVTVTPPQPPSDAPTASFTTAPNKVTAPQRIECNGSNSAATAGRTLTEWIWRFGDGTSPQSRNNDDPIRHNYVTDEPSETFTITLIVIDDEDGTDTEQREVVVENEQPVAGFEIYDLADPGSPPAGGAWLADDVTFPETGDPAITADNATVWVGSEPLPLAWEGATPAPNDGTKDEPDPNTGEPGNYDDHDMCYDPEGQGWDAGTPFGWPNVAWGIEFYKVNWGDGNTEYFPYATSFDPGDTAGLRQPHTYINLVVGANNFTITVTAIDYLGGETDFSREITINRTS